MMTALAPQSIADAGSDAARAALALICRSPRDALRSSRLMPPAPDRTRCDARDHVDDDTDAGDRQARFGDVRCEHDASGTTAIRSAARILRGGIECPPCSRQHAHTWRWSAALLQHGRDAADFTRAGQEHQQIAGCSSSARRIRRSRTLRRFPPGER